MNYQTSALWFYNPLYLLAALTCLGLSFVGFSSPLFYMMMVGLVLPVIVSMRLHILSETGNTRLIKDRSDWMMYVYGLPVHEQRSSLTNPCFISVDRLRQFYLRGFSSKLAIQVSALTILLVHAQHIELNIFNALTAGTLLCLIVWLLVATMKTIRAIINQQWEIQAITFDDGVLWYQAFLQPNKHLKPALSILLSLK